MATTHFLVALSMMSFFVAEKRDVFGVFGAIYQICPTRRLVLSYVYFSWSVLPRSRPFIRLRRSCWKQRGGWRPRTRLFGGNAPRQDACRSILQL
jgi:hypothetical protein